MTTVNSLKRMCCLLTSIVSVGVVALLMVSCSEDTIEDMTYPESGVKTYTMVVKTDLSAEGTRALAYDESGTYPKIKAYWEIGDKVAVFHKGTRVGTLTATDVLSPNDGHFATLEGTITVPEGHDIEYGDILKLVIIPSAVEDLDNWDNWDGTFNYGTQDSPQDGTIDGIAANNDRAIATVRVISLKGDYYPINENWEGCWDPYLDTGEVEYHPEGGCYYDKISNFIAISPHLNADGYGNTDHINVAYFSNQQAIIKFNFKDEGGHELNIRALTINWYDSWYGKPIDQTELEPDELLIPVSNYLVKSVSLGYDETRGGWYDNPEYESITINRSSAISSFFVAIAYNEDTYSHNWDTWFFYFTDYGSSFSYLDLRAVGEDGKHYHAKLPVEGIIQVGKFYNISVKLKEYTPNP